MPDLRGTAPTSVDHQDLSLAAAPVAIHRLVDSLDAQEGRRSPHGVEIDVFLHITAVERAGMRGLNEGQKVSSEEQRDPEPGRTSAENLKVV